MMTDTIFHNLAHLLVYDAKSPLVFSSGLFLVMLVAFLFVYYLLQHRYLPRIAFVVAFSYYFYYKSSGIYFFLLAVVTVSDFLIARAIARDQAKGALESRKRQKWLMALSVAIGLGLLAYFKYANFFGMVVADIIGSNFQLWDIFLPVGISFFTFQSMSYTIDVYRRRLTPLQSMLDYAFYVSFFPQLVAGPIVRARDFVPQIRRRLVINNRMIAMGVYLIVIGLFKKAVISDYISLNFVDRIFDNPLRYTGVENLLGILGYLIQIYCDFSGYSDMAIGIALLLGFRFPDNFNAPYNAESVTDFWRRWHISLSSWIRDYVYVAWLGGNRRGPWRTAANVMVAMVLCGLWHGASWNFIAFGVLAGASLVAHKWWRAQVMHHDRHYRSRGMRRVGAVVATLGFNIVLFMVFRNRDLGTFTTVFRQIFTNFHLEVAGQWLASYTYVAALIALGFATHYIPRRWERRIVARLTKANVVVYALILTAVIFLVMQTKTSDVQPFIYFQF